MPVPLHREPLDELYRRRLAGLVKTAPFVLRITRWRGVTGPVLVVKERLSRPQSPSLADSDVVRPLRPALAAHLVERGHIAASAQRRVLPILRSILGRVRDDSGVPLRLERWMSVEGLRHMATLPLDEEAGAKFALVFRLHERILDLDRVELIARRVERLTREEANYLLSRTSRFGPAANRWALAGLRLLLGGQPGDPAVQDFLNRLRGI
jgi:hypothetical protein